VPQPLARPDRFGQVFQPDAVFGQAWRDDLSTPLCVGQVVGQFGPRLGPESAASIAPPSGPPAAPDRSSGPRRAVLRNCVTAGDAASEHPFQRGAAEPFTM
jgi:hypothetical protein